MCYHSINININSIQHLNILVFESLFNFNRFNVILLLFSTNLGITTVVFLHTSNYIGKFFSTNVYFENNFTKVYGMKLYYFSLINYYFKMKTRSKIINIMLMTYTIL